MVCRTPLLQLFQQLVYAAGMVLQALELILSQNIIKLQTTDNQV